MRWWFQDLQRPGGRNQLAAPTTNAPGIENQLSGRVMGVDVQPTRKNRSKRKKSQDARKERREDFSEPKVKPVAFQIPEPVPQEEIAPVEDQTIVEELKEAPAIGLEEMEGDDQGFFDGEFDDEENVVEVIAEREPSINDFVFAEEEPQPLNLNEMRRQVSYPEIARDAAIEGTVVVRVLVDKEGNYKQHKVVNQVHPILSKEVEKQLHRLKFTPAIQGGEIGSLLGEYPVQI